MCRKENAVSEPPKPSTEIEFFKPQEMQARVERLKAAGKLPPLADLLKTVRKAAAEHGLEKPKEKGEDMASSEKESPDVDREKLVELIRAFLDLSLPESKQQNSSQEIKPPQGKRPQLQEE
jgi:hypothetical protein